VTDSAATMQRGLYAYAITRAGALDLHGVTGITGAAPRLITHREWGVRLFDTTERETSSGGTSTSAGARMSGTAYLAQRRSELAAAQQRREFVDSAAGAVRATLDGHASDCVSRTGRAQPRLLLDTAYLVPVAAEPAFLAEVDQLAKEMAVDGLHLDLTGPWPPYSFAQLDYRGGARD